jgi:photosystem II stability/assembly factor-like uncharacterized protein
LRGIYFVNDLTGYASPYGCPIRKTTDAGLNWFDQTNPTGNSYILRIDFIDANTGWIVGHNSNAIEPLIYFSGFFRDVFL